ncbi:MAG: hypothetical protein Q9N34_07900, partial [Aquificota bacterium]|nr:hypothetical protein [Aquificota bacterium]
RRRWSVSENHRHEDREEFGELLKFTLAGFGASPSRGGSTKGSVTDLTFYRLIVLWENPRR